MKADTSGKETPEGADKVQEQEGKELESVRHQMLRLQADFENARKRWLKEQAEIQEVANADLLRELLDIFDDFQRALSAVSSAGGAETFRIGVEMIAKRMESLLKSYGVVAIESVGKLFDANLHEAVAHEPTDSAPESTVLAELRRGYMMNGRVLRHSVVKVAVKPEDPTSAPQEKSLGTEQPISEEEPT